MIDFTGILAEYTDINYYTYNNNNFQTINYQIYYFLDSNKLLIYTTTENDTILKLATIDVIHDAVDL